MSKTRTYAILDASNGMDFRSIAKHMDNEGHSMSAAQVRLIMIRLLEDIIQGIAAHNGYSPLSRDRRHEVAISPEFQNFIAPFIVQAMTNNTDTPQMPIEDLLRAG